MIRVLDCDGQLLATEGFFHGETIPCTRNGRADMQTVCIRTHTADTLYAADHNSGCSTGQPVYVRTSCIRGCCGLGELTVYIRFQHTLFCLVVHGCRRAFLEVTERIVTVTQQALCQDQPALRLGEDTAVFLGIRIENVHQCAVEIVVDIRRIQQLQVFF